MKTRYAIVNDGVVTSIISWDGLTPWEEVRGLVIALEPGERVSEGFLFDGKKFKEPPKADARLDAV